MKRRGTRVGLGALVALLLVFGIIQACAVEPITGRRQFMLLSVEEENQLGAAAFQEILTTSQVSGRTGDKARLEAVGRRIVAQIDPRSEFAGIEWQFELIADPQVNAFALPGGKVAFYEGIMPICDTDTGIAVVMGHEIGHVIARHGGERVSQGMLAQGGLQVAQIIGSMVGSEEDAAIRDGAMLALGVAAQGTILSYSRKHESSADRIGLTLMARAGYDPSEAVRFWERMKQATGDSGEVGLIESFLRTHPPTNERIEELKKWLPEARAIYEKVRTN